MYLTNRCDEVWILSSDLDHTSKPPLPFCNSGRVDCRGRGSCLRHRRLELPTMEARRVLHRSLCCLLMLRRWGMLLRQTCECF